MSKETELLPCRCGGTAKMYCADTAFRQGYGRGLEDAIARIDSLVRDGKTASCPVCDQREEEAKQLEEALFGKGYVLVPVEPTNEQKVAIMTAIRDAYFGNLSVRKLWADVLQVSQGGGNG